MTTTAAPGLGAVDWGALAAPFPANEIEWRLQQAGEKNGKIWGMALAYVTNRAICNRLDEVVRPWRWRNEFKAGPEGGVLCGIAIYVSEELGWVTKWDGAENTDIEAVKGGLSGAMKRAASTGWGIGRYLYNLEEGWVQPHAEGQYRGQTKDKKPFRWNPPKLPAWALPQAKAHEPQKGAPALHAEDDGPYAEEKPKEPSVNEMLVVLEAALDDPLLKPAERKKILENTAPDMEAIRKAIAYTNQVIRRRAEKAEKLAGNSAASLTRELQSREPGEDDDRDDFDSSYDHSTGGG
jgi:hypothetical protein